MDVKQEIAAIKERNKRVEADKAWETSWTRRIVIFVLTYLVIVVFFYVTGLSDPWLNALVPSLAFLLSNMILPAIKKIWLRTKQKSIAG